MLNNQPVKPVHVNGARKGEELVREHGREPGRTDRGRNYRTARDATGLNASAHGPIDPRMPEIPPA